MKNKTMKVATMGIFAASQLVLVGCNSNGSNVGGSANATSNTTANSASLGSSVNLTILQGGAAVSPSALKAGQSYIFHVDASNVPSGASIVLLATNVDVVGAAPSSTTLQVGDNNYSPTTPGDFAYKVEIISGSSTVTAKSYQASVSCATPAMTANSLNAAGITVTAVAGTSNMYNVNAANVVASANGQGPYLCAWDLTGTGIVDTGFTSCTTTLTNQYINYVGNRNIGVVVKDSCNTSYAISASPAVNLGETAMPAAGGGNVFIYGQMSGATGHGATVSSPLAQNDKRINNVTYLATNEMLGSNNTNVQPNYNDQTGTSFKITSNMNYGQVSSLNFGVEIDVTGLGGTFNLHSNPTGSFSDANATVSKVTYTTDQAGDQLPATSMTSTSCTSTVHATVVPTQGSPCTGANPLGDQNLVQVEVWGTYNCTMVGPEGTSNFTGDFDGLQHIADSCTGGGQGGGGITTITE